MVYISIPVQMKWKECKPKLLRVKPLMQLINMSQNLHWFLNRDNNINYYCLRGQFPHHLGMSMNSKRLEYSLGHCSCFYQLRCKDCLCYFLDLQFFQPLQVFLTTIINSPAKFKYLFWISRKFNFNVTDFYGRPNYFVATVE